MPDYFGHFRIGKKNHLVTLADGTKVPLAIVSNPIDSGSPDVQFEGKKLTRAEATRLWKRDKKRQPLWLEILG